MALQLMSPGVLFVWKILFFHHRVGTCAALLLLNFRIISFDVLRLNEVTKFDKNLWWNYQLDSNLWSFTTYIKQKSAKPNNKTALLLAYSHCSFSFSVTSLGVPKHSTKIEVISMSLHVNQPFIAYHTLTNQVQSLLTKPQLSTLGLALIWPQNSKENLNLDTYLLKQFSYHFLSLYLQLRNFLNYLERAIFGFYSI